MICKRCKKVFEVFFCPECTEVSVEILAQMMDKELEKKGQNLTTQFSGQTCNCAQWKNLTAGHCPIHFSANAYR